MTFIDELTHLGQAGHLGGTSLDGEPGTPERALAEAQLKNSEAEAKLSKATAHLESAKATKAKADAEAEEKKGGPDPQNIERRSKDKQKRLEQMKPLKDKLKVMDEKLGKVKDKGELRRAALPPRPTSPMRAPSPRGSCAAGSGASYQPCAASSPTSPPSR